MRKSTMKVMAIMAGWVGLSAGLAQATVIYQDDFTGELNGATPNSGGTNWFVANFTNSNLAINAGVGNAAPSIGMVDTSTVGGDASNTSLNFGVSAFSPFNMNNAGQEVLKVSFDLRVDAFANTSNGSGSTMRVSLRNGGINRFFIVGIARNTLSDGDAASDVFLYAGDSGTSNFFSSISASQAIGFTGTGWAPGFNLGDYDTVGINNGTRPVGGSGPEWYRFALTFVKDSTNVEVQATRLSTGQSTISNMTTGAAFSFSNTGTDIIAFLSPGGGTATAYLDNIVIENTAIPEPLSLVPLTLGSLALLRRSR